MSADLESAHQRLAAALEPLGIDVGPEVLDVWLDRERYGREPLPASALRRLAGVARGLLQDVETAWATLDTR